MYLTSYTNGKAVAGTGNEANAQATPSPKQKVLLLQLLNFLERRTLKLGN